MSTLYAFNQGAIYLSPAPQYHSAPVGFTMAVMLFGGTVVVLEPFDAEGVLRAIETYKVTHAQYVPTHFVRLLNLPEAVRSRYYLSSLRYAIHAAAPCPPEVKQRIMAWWGPILHEYYGGCERFGLSSIGPQDWLAHRGSVGRSRMGPVHIVDPDTGQELPPHEIGLIYFENTAGFAYHKDPAKTAEALTTAGWGTHGDMGWLDEDGFIYLADRQSNMIISGGVNIYPQEIENLLIGHPAVADVAVIGVPNAEFGEEVKAVVRPTDLAAASEALAAELIALCRAELAGFKCPSTVDFVDAFPRNPKGMSRSMLK